MEPLPPQKIELVTLAEDESDEGASLMTTTQTNKLEQYDELTLAQRFFSSDYSLVIFGLLVTSASIGIVLLLVLLVPDTAPPAPTVPNSTVIYEGFSSYLSWHEANQHCQKWGGRLAESTTMFENEKIFQECSKAQRCWLGASDLETEGRWVWSGSGTELGEHQQWWKHGTPDNGLGQEEEDCLYMYGKTYLDESLHSFWNDKACTKKLSGHVCQKDRKTEIMSDCKGYASQLECPAKEFDHTIDPTSASAIETPPPPRCPSLDAVRRHDEEHYKTFAVIGDYGIVDAGCEIKTISLLNRLQAAMGHIDFLLSTGDNAYWDGTCQAYNKSVLPFFQQYFEPGHTCNDTHPVQPPKHIGLEALRKSKFFPSMGNHDWKPAINRISPIIPYFQIFPHVAIIDELYLDTQSRQSHNLPPRTTSKDELLTYGGFYQHSPLPGIVDVFVVNSNLGNPLEQMTFQYAFELQSQWLERALEISTAAFKIVVMHHPPYSTAAHDPPATHMRYPFKAWGVDLVLSGHQHVYERLEVNNVTHVINGLGGHHWRYEIEHCNIVAEGSKKRYNEAHGIMYGVVTADELALCFYSVENNTSSNNKTDGKLIDEFVLQKNNNNR